MPRNRLVQIASVAFLIAVFATLRVWKMGDTCLWFDEIFSVHAASHPWNSILSFVALDLIHPPLFYVVLKLWIAVGGDGTVWLRSLPIALSVIAIVPLFLLLEELKQSFNVKAITLCLLLFSGSILKYSVEVRMYSLMLCLSLFSMWLFMRYVDRQTRIIPLIAINILLVYAHYFGWFVVASEVIAAVFLYRGARKKICMMAAVTALSFVPWMLAVWNAAGVGGGLSQNIGWMSRPGLRETTTFAFNLIEPFYFQLGSADPLSNLVVTIPMFLLLLTIAIITTINWQTLEKQTRKTISTLVIFVTVPIASAFAASWASPYSIWGTRHLILVFVPFLIISAIAACNLPGRGLRVAMLVCGLSLCSLGGVMNATREAEPFAWCEAGPLTAGITDTTPIYAVEDLIAYHLWFDHRKDQPQRHIVKLENISGLGEDKAFFLPRGFDEISRLDIDAVTEPKLWLVQRGKTLKDTEPPLRNFLMKGYKIVDRKTVSVTGEEVGAYMLEK